jgi:hypothetical protein
MEPKTLQQLFDAKEALDKKIEDYFNTDKEHARFVLLIREYIDMYYQFKTYELRNEDFNDFGFCKYTGIKNMMLSFILDMMKNILMKADHDSDEYKTVMELMPKVLLV